MSLSEKALGRTVASQNPTPIGWSPFLARSGVADGRVNTDVEEGVKEAQPLGTDANRCIARHHDVTQFTAAVLIDVGNCARFAIGRWSRRFHGNGHHNRSRRNDHPGVVLDHDAHDG